MNQSNNWNLRSAPGGSRPHNLGVDLLRCAAMWMIACLHIINRGGVSGAVIGNGSASTLLWPLRFVVACGVNIYALISGYVTVYGRFRPARVVELWLQVLFWNLVIAGLGEWVQPHIMDDFWLRYLLPLTQKCFWYFTAYVGVYSFSPLINRGIRALNPRQCRALVWVMLLLFSFGTWLGCSNQGDPWSIGSGYSVLWLLALYVVGACVRHGNVLGRTAWWKLLLIALGCVLTSTLWRELLQLLPEDLDIWKNQKSQLLSYTNPLLAVFSLCLLALFSRLRVQGLWAALVKFFAPLTFGVYIIHVHHVPWTWMEQSYKPLGKLSPVLVVPAVLLAGLGIFLAGSALDWVRSRIFRLLRIRKGLDRLEARCLERLK